MTTNDSRLDSWKSIAEYLNKDVRTVIRWEKERGLPVHRLPGQKRSSVYAWAAEIDSWRANGNGIAPSAPASAVPSVTQTAPITESTTHRWSVPTTVLTTMLLAVAFGFWVVATRPSPPRLGSAVRIPHDGGEKNTLVATKRGIFVSSRNGGHTTITRIDRETGIRDALPVTLTDFSLLDGSSDGSRLLVSAEDSPGCEGPLWVVPTNGEPARRLNNTCATAGSWSLDGKGLAYVTGLDLYVAKADGTEPRKLATLPAGVDAVTWSPNGERLRFAVSRSDIPSRLWEARLDGSGAHPVLDGWSSGDDQETRGRWTPDGKYYLFNAIHNGVQALWGMREEGSGWDWRDPQPFTLLLSPDGPADIAFTTDRKKLLVAMSTPLHGELMRYEPRAGKFFNWPDVAGLSAGQTSFRRDGQKIAYISYPDLRLWTMNPDGANRRELAHYAALPDWSPDGRQIAYMCWDKPDQPTRICTIAADGGVLQHPVPGPAWQGGPSWTPDGKVLFFGDNGPTNPIPPTCKIHQFDFVAGKLTDVPGSQGLWTARVSPTGRYVAAMTVRNEKLVLFDRERGVWKELASFGGNKLGDNPVWSKDGEYLFIDVPFSSDPGIYRIRVPDGQPEQVVKLTGLDRPTGLIGVWLGLTPDSRPLLTRKVQASEIYAMDWIEP